MLVDERFRPRFDLVIVETEFFELRFERGKVEAQECEDGFVVRTVDVVLTERTVDIGAGLIDHACEGDDAGHLDIGLRG